MTFLRQTLLWGAFIGCFFLFAIIAMSNLWLPFLWTLAVFPLAGCFYFATKLFDESKRGGKKGMHDLTIPQTLEMLWGLYTAWLTDEDNKKLEE